MFSATTLLTGSGDVWQYIQDNSILFIILGVCLILIIAIIVILCLAKKKKKEPAALPSEETEQTDEAPLPSEEAAPVASAEETDGVNGEAQTDAAAEAPAAALTVRPKGELQTTQQPAEEAADTATESAPAENGAPQEPQKTAAADAQSLPADEEEQEEDAEVVVDDAPTQGEEEGDDEPAAFAGEDEDAAVPYAGKWELLKLSMTDALGNEKDSAFFFRLKASNGESLLTSEDYTSLRGAQQGIETFKSNIARGNFKISITRKGKFIVKLLTNQGNLLAQGEKYSTRAQAMSAIASIKRFAETAIRDDELKTATVAYRESTETERTYDPEKRGKWVIHKVIMESENDASYCFELRASNGQVLFTSEEYATVASLKNGIKTHKKNIEEGNIRAAITRNGDYIFKIFSGNGQLLCLGGHYKTRQLCESAIESVRHFARDAKLDLDKIFPDEK